MSVVTISAIKADIAGYVGHSAIHPDLLEGAQRRVVAAGEQGLPIDGAVNSCGDDVNLVMTHRDRVDAEPVHHFAWDTFGPFEPGRLPMEDMEYTTMPQVAERMQERWEAIEEPAPIPA